MDVLSTVPGWLLVLRGNLMALEARKKGGCGQKVGSRDTQVVTTQPNFHLGWKEVECVWQASQCEL